ncbi:MAG: histone deacetylase [Myxococcota bacterium]
MTTLLLVDEAMIDHDPGAGHPERPDRLRAVVEHFRRRPIEGTRTEAPTEASLEAVARVHPAEHIQRIEDARGQTRSLDPDTHISPGSVAAARLAAGAGIAAVDAVMSEGTDNAFAFVRPPGHHALPDRAMGFCLYNNIAIAAEHARQAHDLQRVLIVDWDVHHGNGTEAIFYGRDDVLFFSTHQFPFYPGTGAVGDTGHEGGVGTTINVPFGAGATDGDLRRAFQELLEPVAESFKPELVLVSAGFDAHRLDPLGQLEATADGFGDLCASVKGIAEQHAGGRLVLMLEGGYDLEGLATSTHACARVLAGETAPDQRGATTAGGDRSVAAAIASAGDRWRLR